MIEKKELIRLASIIFLPVLLVANVAAEIPADLLNDAKKGDANAQFSVARSYELGKRVKSDKKKALEWYTKSAEQGHLEASYRLGLIYYKGIGGYKIDLKQAYKYISKAASGNHKRSQTHLAKMYENGDGVTKNKVLSDYWYDQSFNSNIQSLDAYLNAKKSEGSAPSNIKNDPVVKKTISKQKKSKPKPVVKRAAKKFPASVLSENWLEDNKPSIYLKSSTTNCKKKGNKVSCTSAKRKGRHPTGLYTYKVKSIITKGASSKELKVVYRKLYLSVPEESVGGYDDEDESADDNRLTAGWEKSAHKLSCKFESARSILCRAVGEDAFYIKAK